MAKTSKAKKQRPESFKAWLAQLPSGKAKPLVRERDRLVKCFRKPNRKDPRWWYKVGTSIDKLSSRADSTHGAGLIELLANEVAPKRDRSDKSLVTQFYQYRNFARAYSSEEAAKLAEHIRDRKISVQHVAHLITVSKGNRKSRKKFLELAVKHQWSANELQRAIQDDKRGGLPRYGGRRPKPRTKKNPGLAARDVTVVARRWVAYHEAYFQDQGPLTTTPEKVSSELLRELDAALASVTMVAKQAAEAKKLLTNIVKEIKADGKAKPKKGR